MLSSTASEPFDSTNHLFEVKWDGVRALCFIDRDRTTLYSRSGRDSTHHYPELSRLHERLKVGSAVIDAEIVALESGRPSFQLLQQRLGIERPGDVVQRAEKISLDLICFDLPFVGGEWIGTTPLEDRIARLPEAIEFGGRIIRSEPIPENGRALFEAARAKGLEGIVAKRLGSQYLPGKRNRDWLKIKVIRSMDVVVGGFTLGTRSRSATFGALLVGAYVGEELRLLGQVGTGFTDQALASWKRMLDERQSQSSPFAEPAVVMGEPRWIRPEIVCEIEYRELTNGLRLRAPSYKGICYEKSPKDCILPAS